MMMQNSGAPSRVSGRVAPAVTSAVTSPGPLRGSARQVREGLTLFEVVVSMAIFAVALVPILQLVLLGTDRALDVKLQSRTSMLCQSKMSEIIIGAQPIKGGSAYSDYPDQKDIQWMMDSKESTVTGLYEVKVNVRATLANGKTIETQLSRLVLDPTLRGSTLGQPPLAQ